MKTQKIQLNEKQLRNLVEKIVKRSVKKILSEQIGGSSANGYGYDWNNGGVQRNQGGAFGGSELDQAYDNEKYEREQEARRRQEAQEKYKNWCYQNYDYVMSVCPGYMNSGEYEKAYRYCN